MSRGKIVLVPFPFDDLSATKLRPALCLTEPFGAHKHIILAFITSVAPGDATDTDLYLDARDAEFGTTGLRVSSTVRLHRLLSVSAILITRELGTLSGTSMELVSKKLRTLFSL